MDAEEIKKKVRKIYENYGIDTDSIPDEDLSIVYSSYAKDLDALNRDSKKSEEVAKRINQNGLKTND